jgi:hypothetical protein
MAIPAVRGDSHVVVTLVAKLGLVGMALHAGGLKALVIYLTG